MQVTQPSDMQGFRKVQIDKKSPQKDYQDSRWTFDILETIIVPLPDNEGQGQGD
jgi:hypothetical protein